MSAFPNRKKTKYQAKSCLDPLAIMHGQGQLSARKSLCLLEMKDTCECKVGPVCPRKRGAGQFVPDVRARYFGFAGQLPGSESGGSELRVGALRVEGSDGETMI